MNATCQLCEHPLAILGRPLKRLRWTRYWWRGLQSLLSSPLRVCTKCGAIYTFNGQLVAAGAAETDAELRLRGFKDDMAHLRDGFATVVLTGEVGVIWTMMSSVGYDPTIPIIMGTVGALAIAPCAYFARKASLAKKDLKLLKAARKRRTESG
ncbi:MAG: hypothetical protein O7I93_11285 [Gemmatimonadetes bacterium]|nr:hypothetical protein [Gemmatimonadota bacterium]